MKQRRWLLSSWWLMERGDENHVCKGKKTAVPYIRLHGVIFQNTRIFAVEDFIAYSPYSHLGTVSHRPPLNILSSLNHSFASLPVMSNPLISVN
jgi:hypothetical protein